MNRIRICLDKSIGVLAGISFLIMVTITAWQVAARYLFKSPSTWSEELVSYLFAWTSLFGACLVTGERGHMNIPIVRERLSGGARKALAVAGEVVALSFSAIILLYGGVQITKLAMGQLTSSLGVAVGVFYFILPLTGVLNGLYTLLNIYDILRSKNGAEE